MYLGAIGTDTNNSTELEGLIQGFECLIREGWLPATIEGDTNILIQMARCLSNGRTSEKIYSSWHLASHLDTLRSLIAEYSMVSFSHVGRDANKVADLLANAAMDGGTEYRSGTLEDF